MKVIGAGLVLISFAGLQCIAQTPAVQSFSGGQIAALELTLKEHAAASYGTVMQQLASYPGFYTALIYRDKSGQVEIHRDFDEVMIVLDGKATVQTGGKPENVRPIGPGEMRGSAATGATAHALDKGATVHILANTPHQVIVPPGGHVSYVDVKIRHTPR